MSFNRSFVIGVLAAIAVGVTHCPVFAQFDPAAEPVEAPNVFKLARVGNQGQLLNEYRLHKYDVLNVVIVGYSGGFNFKTKMSTTLSGNDNANSSTYVDELDSIMIGPDGYANLPYIGTVKLSGLTLNEATEVLTERLSEYIKIPMMNLMIKEYGKREIHVLGEVNSQGIYNLPIESMDVFSAITKAGGIKKKGRPKHIQIIRIVDDKLIMKEVNFDQYVKKQDITQNIALEAGDLVYVPSSNKVDFMDDIMPYISVYGVYKNLTD